MKPAVPGLRVAPRTPSGRGGHRFQYPKLLLPRQILVLSRTAAVRHDMPMSEKASSLYAMGQLKACYRLSYWPRHIPNGTLRLAAKRRSSPGSAWWREVERYHAERDGDTEKIAQARR